MSDALQKVKPGDSLNIPAATYNAFVDAARAHRDGQLGKGGAGARSTRDSGIVYVKNRSNTAISRFAAIGFREGTDSTTYDPPFTPTDALESFQNTPVINVYSLFRSYNDGDGNHDSRGRFAIALEPIASGEIGRACISGLCVAQIYVQDERHRYADVVAVGESLLWSDRTGAAQILWKESGTGTKWAVLRLGVPAAHPIQYGKVVSYTFGTSSFTVNPCDWRGYDVDTSETITIRLVPFTSSYWAYYPLTRALSVGDVVAFQHLYTEIYSPFGRYGLLVDPKIVDLIKVEAINDAILDTDVLGDGHPGKGPQGGHVEVHPFAGNELDENTTFTITLPAIGSGAPCVHAGDTLLVRAYDLVCMSQYMDDAIGMIKIWSGASNDIPAGWALCNGENDTVDLTGRFVVQVGTKQSSSGYTVSYSVGDTGGFEFHGKSGPIDENNHDDHEIPNHGQNFKNADSGSMEVLGSISSSHPDLSHSYTDNRPPYYALAFIQRIN